MNATIGFDLIFTGEDLHAALFVSLLTAFLVVALLVYLNRFTKRRYFTIWTVAWLFYALWLLLNFRLSHLPEQPLGFILKQCCVGASAVFLLWGSADFLRIQTRGHALGLFLVFLVFWSALGSFHLDRALDFQIPLFLLIGATSLLTSWCYFQARRTAGAPGAELLSLGFLLWGAYLIAFPFFRAADQLSSVFLISVVLHLFIAISMIVAALEDGKAATRRATQAAARQESETQLIRNRAHSAEERFRHLFEQANEAIVVASAKDFSILELNEKARGLFGVGKLGEDRIWLGQYLKLELPNPAPTDGDSWFKMVTERESIPVQRRDGHVTPTLVDGSEIRFDDRNAYQLFFRDVTEKAQLEQKLRQAEKLSALGQMISGIAHELNNPLTAIRGYLELILDQHELEDATRADLKKVADESNRAARLVSQFLHFAHERQAQREVADLNQIIRLVVEMREFEFRVAGVALTLELAEYLPATLVDPDQAQQILLNLINNSLHALVESPPPLRLEVRSRVEGEWIRVEIEDNGPGIPSDRASRIFEPFYTTKEVGSGTGLGLSIAHSIMTDHGGSIEYRPARPGGAIFSILFPLTTESSEEDTRFEAIAEPSVAEAVDEAEPARILVLDDEKSIAEMLGEMLELLGHKPTLSNAGDHALELIAETEFDVILSDFRMPNMNGRQFYDEVKRTQPGLASRIIFLSGDVVNQETQDFLKSTGNSRIDKPFKLVAVREALGRALARRRKRS